MSQRLFEAYPPFPEDVQTASIPKVSLAQLVAGNQDEALGTFRACRTMGFFLLDLKGEANGEKLLHDIDTLFGIVEDVMDLSLEEKIRYKQNPPADYIGYKALGVMKTETGQPDLCEFFNVGQDEVLGNKPCRIYPKPVQDNMQTFASFLTKAYPVVQLILDALDAQLGLPNGKLASLQPRHQLSGTVVRMIRYPPQSLEHGRTSLVGHTDYGTITLLCNVLGGLQILPPGATDEAANWRYVKPEPNCVIVNLGDAMVTWTGEILRSNMHRVTFAPGKQGKCPRYSVAYLIRPERNVPMKRLVGGYIPSAAEDGEEESALSANEWEIRKATALTNGSDCAKSRGG